MSMVQHFIYSLHFFFSDAIPNEPSIRIFQYLQEPFLLLLLFNNLKNLLHYKEPCGMERFLVGMERFYESMNKEP